MSYCLLSRKGRLHQQQTTAADKNANKKAKENMSDIDENLEELYKPSAWCTRFETSEEVINSHIEFVKEESEKSRQNYKNRLNIRYGPGKNETLDIYYKGEESGTPIFVYVHGGYWQELKKDFSAYCVQPIVEAGHRVAVVGYDLCPSVSLREIVAEIKRAGDFILEYAKETNASSVVFAGHSAGAHLLACLLEKETFLNPLVKAVVLISGVFDLTELWRTMEVNRNNILSLTEEDAKELSPLFKNYLHVFESHKNLTIYLYAGENESPTYLRMSRDFSKHLEYFGSLPKFEILQGRDHFDIVEKLSDPNFEISQCILNELKK